MEKALDVFLKTVAEEGINLSGVMVYQHGSTTAKYLKEDVPRSLYSVTKSFLATAVGILLDEGALCLQDRPVDFFPGHLPDDLGPGYERLTLRHLLTMTSGHGRRLLHEQERRSLEETDWIHFVFSQPLVSVPGERFLYSNGSAYLVGCMAEKAAGAKLKDFLYEKLFVPLKIPFPEWEECPMGHTFAASGLKLRLSDMIKLGILYLNGGSYEGKRIVSKEWVEAATSYKVASSPVSTVGTAEDETYGYGYQFWMSRYPGIYRAFGRLGQFVIVAPQRDAVIAASACEENEQRLLDAIWRTVLPVL